MSAACTCASAANIPNFERVRVLETPRPISDAVLTDQDGKSFALSQLHGKVVLVFFGYTNCPDVCPVAMAKWRSLEQSGLLDLDNVAFVLVSVDGDRDTPEVMKTFLDNFSKRFIGLTAPPAKIKPIARQFSASFFKGNPTGHEGHYDVTHSSQAFLLDPEGMLRAELYDPPVESMAGIIQALLDESSGSD